VPYPEVLDTGCDGDLAWQVTRVVEGVPLATLWGGLSHAERRDAVHQIGQALAALHAHRFPSDVVAALAAPRPVGDTSTSALVGADITVLPLRRAESLLAAARHEGRADRALIDDVAARFRELADADPLTDAPLAEADRPAEARPPEARLARPAEARRAGARLADARLAQARLAEARLAEARPTEARLAEDGPLAGAVTCVHGDAHLGNALWKDGRLTALLDFEWVRLGPPDLEIEPYLRADTAGLTHTELGEALGWLAESYPAMFAGPDLVRRLWLYQLANAVRELFLDGPGQPPDGSAQRQLRRIVKSPDHLLRILPARQ
jgi:aminoglycoside phosphotransferase